MAPALYTITDRIQRTLRLPGFDWWNGCMQHYKPLQPMSRLSGGEPVVVAGLPQKPHSPHLVVRKRRLHQSVPCPYGRIDMQGRSHLPCVPDRCRQRSPHVAEVQVFPGQCDPEKSATCQNDPFSTITLGPSDFSRGTKNPRTTFLPVQPPARVSILPIKK